MPHKNLLKYIIVFLTFLISSQARAGHVTSIEITYRWIDTLTYEVNYYFYRSCAGVAFTNPSSTTRVVCKSSGANVGLSLSLKSISELQTVCDTLGGQCGGVNQVRGGDGIEIHHYQDTVDFRTAKFKSVLGSSCTAIRFDVGLCCRNSSINTGAANKNFYNYADLNLALGDKNSSPEFALPAIPKFICNQPVFYSTGAIDTVDHDSLSFHLVQPMSSSTSTITMQVPPFTTYYPGSLKYPYTNPHANPPIGFYFDEETGATIFVPTKCGETTVMVYEVREWRKDSTGKYKMIGAVRRDVMYSVVLGKGNNPPTLGAPRSFTICEGEAFCRTFTTSDKVKVPPPPEPKPDPDTTRISWNRGIQDASFTIVNDSALNQSARFCWTPKAGDARTLPYQFAIMIKDNNCPANAISYYPIQVQVKPTANATVVIDSLGCGRYAVTSKIDSSKTIQPRYFWSVVDTNSSISPTRKAPNFLSSKTFISAKNTDTIQFNKNGVYVLQHTLNNREKCPRTYFDTIVVNDVVEAWISYQADTFVCQGDAKLLQARTVNAGKSLQYVWSTGDTTSSITYTMNDTIVVDDLTVNIVDDRGCKAEDSIQVYKRNRPTIDNISDVEICIHDSVQITPTGSLAFWDNPRDNDSTLFRQGSNLTFTLINQGGSNYSDTVFNLKPIATHSIFCVDSLGCTDTSMFEVAPPQINMPSDLEVCADAGTINLRLMEDSQNAGGVWSCLSDTSLVTLGYLVHTDKFITNGKRTIKTIYYNVKHKLLGCQLIDSFTITVNPLPAVLLQDGAFCQDKGTVHLRDDKVLLQPGGGSINLGRQTWKCVDCGSYLEDDLFEDVLTGLPGAPQEYVLHIDNNAMPLGATSADSISIMLEFRNAYGCINRDTAKIKVVKVPKINFTAFQDLCWDEGIVYLNNLTNVGPTNGIWKAIDSSGYAPALDLNVGLNGDTLNTLVTKQPSENGAYTYLMRYTLDASACVAIRDTTLTIRGLPTPIINRSALTKYSNQPPYKICFEEADIELKVNYPGGIFRSSTGEGLDGAIFKPSSVTKLNEPFNIFYDYTNIHGCQGADSVLVEVESQAKLDVNPNDTVHTWYADNMIQWVEAKSNFGYNIVWKAPVGGSFDDSTANKTKFTFQTNKEVTSTVRVLAQSKQVHNACGSEQNEISIIVHRTPCIDFTMDLDLSTKMLKLTPDVDSLAQYAWTVKDSISMDVNASIDVSGYTDSLVNVRLHTYNKAGDDCYTDKVINLKNGSVPLIDSKLLKHYPNPVKNGFSLYIGDEVFKGQVSIYSIKGQLVKSISTNNGYVDCTDLIAGLYTYRIQSKNVDGLGKFIKE